MLDAITMYIIIFVAIIYYIWAIIKLAKDMNNAKQSKKTIR